MKKKDGGGERGSRNERQYALTHKVEGERRKESDREKRDRMFGGEGDMIQLTKDRTIFFTPKTHTHTHVQYVTAAIKG